MKIITDADHSPRTLQKIERQLEEAGIPKYVEFPEFIASGQYVAQRHAAHVIVTLRSELEEGRGYSGGHNTADCLGWPVWWPPKQTGAIASVQFEDGGPFTGCYPSTISFFLVSIETPRLCPFCASRGIAHPPGLDIEEERP